MFDFLARSLFEASVLGTALMSGFSTIGFDGKIYLTPAGKRYLDSLDARESVAASKDR